MSPRAKDPLAAMRKRFNALGYDGDKMVEQMKDPAFRAAFNAPRKMPERLIGRWPPVDAVRLYTRAELPPWAKPKAHHASNVSYFYGRENVPEVWQAIFGVDAVGVMFLDLVHHTPKKKSRILNGDVTPLPGCVLVAVGVEQLRRARAGR